MLNKKWHTLSLAIKQTPNPYRLQSKLCSKRQNNIYNCAYNDPLILIWSKKIMSKGGKCSFCNHLLARICLWFASPLCKVHLTLPPPHSAAFQGCLCLSFIKKSLLNKKCVTGCITRRRSMNARAKTTNTQQVISYNMHTIKIGDLN